MEQITYTNKINVTRNVDVFIAGGGPSGVAAAVFAARMGASVYLVEESGAFGGAAATMLVPMFMQFGDGENFLAAGIGKEVYDYIAENTPKCSACRRRNTARNKENRPRSHGLGGGLSDPDRIRYSYHTAWL